MNRRRFLIGGLLGLIGIGVGWLGLRFGRRWSTLGDSMFDRVVFVCRDDAGAYSPGVYLHGAAGGGPACLDLVRQAAGCMRAAEVGDAAAGLCGFLFKQLGDDVAASGGLSLYDAPKPRPDGTVDWQAYCSWNVDVVLVNVDQAIAECHSSPPDPEAPAKALVSSVRGLQFGG